MKSPDTSYTREKFVAEMCDWYRYNNIDSDFVDKLLFEYSRRIDGLYSVATPQTVARCIMKDYRRQLWYGLDSAFEVPVKNKNKR